MRIELMSRKGDEVFAEWTRESSAEELQTIAERFCVLRGEGYSAFGAASGRRVDDFTASLDEDLVFIAPVVGG